VQLSRSVPQGSLLGPLTFIVLIDDLNTDCMIHKFVDDTTLSEFIDKGQTSQMDVNVTQLLNWSSSNHVNVNFKKTKEMIISTSHCNFPDKLSVADVEIERVNVLNFWVFILINLSSGTTMSVPYVTKQPHVFIF